MTSEHAPRSYIGRFAPSPTGDLHVGSLVAAVASFLQARTNGGRWLIRIEDIDPPREKAGSAERILRDLDRFGMTSDAPVLYQSSRGDSYVKSVQCLLDRDLAYWCGCARSELPRDGSYPGTCSRGLRGGRQPRSIRVRVPARPIRFVDRIQGEVECDLAATCGDFVIRRADGLPAYQLAVVVDDGFQQISEVVRGADLLASTARQIHLQHCLDLRTPDYAHVPVVLGADGKKLSKRLRSDPVGRSDAATTVSAVLNFLGHDAPHLSLVDAWKWAIDHWAIDRVPRRWGMHWTGLAAEGRALPR